MHTYGVILQVVLLDEKEMKLRYLTQENEDLKQQIKLYQVRIVIIIV